MLNGLGNAQIEKKYEKKMIKLKEQNLALATLFFKVLY